MRTTVIYQNFSSTVNGDVSEVAARTALKARVPEIEYCQAEITYSSDRELKTITFKTKSGDLG